MSQCDQVLTHLKRHGSIGPRLALQRFGIMRLAARINDLRDKGHVIRTEIVHHGNRHWAKYYLEGRK